MTHLQVNITDLKLRIHAAKTFHILKENSVKTSKRTLFQTQNNKTTFALNFVYAQKRIKLCSRTLMAIWNKM